MPQVFLTKESKLANRIIRHIPNKAELGRRLGVSRQLINYRVKEIYPKQIAEIITLLDYAGYEIREKE